MSAPDTQNRTTQIIGARREREEAPFAAARLSERVASHVEVRAIHRLEVVCLLSIAAVLVLWVGVNLATGQFAGELRTTRQWGPPVTALVASLVVLALTRSGRFSVPAMVRLGLVYEVVFSLAITAGSTLGAFRGMSAAEFTADRIGLAYVALWTLFFTVLVPAPPRETLAALIASNSSVPILYMLQVWTGNAPALNVAKYLPIFVLPYAINTAMAYFAGRVVHQLGVEVRRAHELGNYRLEELLGRGGMGEVWRASHRMLARPAAVKLIRRDTLAIEGSLAETAVARFEREARVIAGLQSPHTVALYDFGTTEDGMLYYVMELLDGVDLDALVHRFGPLEWERVVHILCQVCASLDEAHQRGVVHRDIKPANIYLCRRGVEHDVVKVLDFGLVKHLEEDPGNSAKLTRADTVAGTPHYMAPEMALGRKDVDGRADLYALGCVGYWLLTGRELFEAETATAAILAHVQRDPTPPSRSTELPVPAELDRVIMDCLAKDPSARPSHAGALASRLRALETAGRWSEEKAAAWWDAHRPSAARLA